MHSPYYAGKAFCNRTLNSNAPDYCPELKDFGKRPVQELQVAALDYVDQYLHSNKNAEIDFFRGLPIEHRRNMT